MTSLPITDPQAIPQAIEYLKSGKLVIYPTDTAYGLAADATNSQAIKHLLQFKGHRQNKPISIAVADQTMAKQYVDLNATDYNLYHHFLPGPLTVVSGAVSPARWPNGLLGGGTTLAIRIPNHSWTLKLIKQFGRPITATSANPSGEKTPYSLKEIFSYKILVLDAGQLPKVPASTIIDTTVKPLKIIRFGSLLSRSSQATQFLGQILAQQNFDIILLDGDLGTGKTTLVKGLAKGLGIKDLVRSSTYTLVKEYSGLIHADFYRLKSLDKILSYIQNLSASGGDKILVVEWPKLLKNPLKLFPHQKILSIKLKIISVNHRYLEFNILNS